MAKEKLKEVKPNVNINTHDQQNNKVFQNIDNRSSLGLTEQLVVSAS